MISVYNTKVKH